MSKLMLLITIILSVITLSESRCPLRSEDMCASRLCRDKWNGYKQRVSTLSDFGMTVRQNVIDSINQIDCSSYVKDDSKCTTIFLGSGTQDGNYLERGQKLKMVGHEGLTCSFFGESKATWIIELLSHADNVLISLDGLKPKKTVTDYTGWPALNEIVESCNFWINDNGMESATCLELMYVSCHKNIKRLDVQIAGESKTIKTPTPFCGTLHKLFGQSAQAYLNNDGVSDKVSWRYLSDGTTNNNVVNLNPKQPKKGGGCFGLCYN
jgi:hypothetical protein